MNEPRCRSAAGAHEAGPGGRAPASPVPPSHTPLNTIALTSPTQTPRPAAQPGSAAREMRPDRGASRGAPRAPVPSPTEQLRGGDFWHTAYIYGENKQGPPARLADVRSGSREERPELRGVSGGVHTFPKELPAPGHGLTPSASANKSARFKAISQNLLNAQNPLKLSSVLGNHEC